MADRSSTATSAPAAAAEAPTQSVAASASQIEPYIDVSYKALALIKALDEAPVVESEDDMPIRLREEIDVMAQELFYKIRDLSSHLALGPLRR